MAPQLTCVPGHSTLPATCPVCEHNPLSAADCNPNKAMRSTVKVFMRTELKKREKKEARDPAPPPTPVDSTPRTQVFGANVEGSPAEPSPKDASSAVSDAHRPEIPLVSSDGSTGHVAQPGAIPSSEEAAQTVRIPAFRGFTFVADLDVVGPVGRGSSRGRVWRYQ